MIGDKKYASIGYIRTDIAHPPVFRVTLLHVVFCIPQVNKYCFTKHTRIKSFHVKNYVLILY